ncbi:MAG: DUF3014 domain-containing protein, partial [Burkholderiales bacterium]|nr:DUF3014 domain-containing protein [Burkholderiales bacterium]
KSSYLIAALLLAAAGVWAWFRFHPGPEAPPPPAAAPQAVQPVTAAPAASAPAVNHPVQAVADSASSPQDVEGTLAALFGRSALATLFRLGDFPHRFVATVDNLGRQQASPRLWPLVPAAGRFGTLEHDGGQARVSPANAERYTPYVRLLDGLDLRAAVAAYRRLYPLFQAAYVDLGYPRGYFNDRLIAVIDLLLATPDPGPLLKVHRPAVEGAEPSRPWLLYEFDDPALQRLSAGQRILLRMGPDYERRVKARLGEFRALLVAAEPPR